MSIKILIVDDSVYHLRVLEKLILARCPGFHIDSYDPVARGMPSKNFKWGDYDVLILDYQLSNGTALDWLQAYRDHAGFPPTIIVTGEGNESIAVSAIKLGASNYLTKNDLSSRRLSLAILEAIEEKTLESTWDFPTIDVTNGVTAQNTLVNKANPTDRKNKSTEKGWNQLKKDIHETTPNALPFTLDDILGGNVKIRDYQIVGYIGKGGMGTVFRAKRKHHDETVAIKLLHGRRTDDATVVQRFIEEYSVIEEMDHPNVVKVYSQGFADDHAYIIMEYLPAGHLRKAIINGIDRKQAINYGYKIVSALNELHKHDIVHRDLKPLNVLFRETNVPVLVDFGIAKNLTRGDLNLTTEGTIVGTPLYSSPEQIRGEPLDHRSDQYAFGVIFYEMLTGRKVFTGENISAVTVKHLEDDPPQLPDKYSDFQPILERLLAKKPRGRFNATEDLMAALGKFL